MYSKEIRERALALLAEGHSAREVSQLMGGKPGQAIIGRWAKGYLPTAKRRRAGLYSVKEKLEAIRRLENGEDYHQIADELGCASSTVLTWRRLYYEGGEEGITTKLDAYQER